MTTITRTAPVENHFRGGIDVRVSLRDDAGSGRSAFDGAWFPRSRELAVELPELIAALQRRGVRVERFTYALEAWQPVDRKLEDAASTLGASTLKTFATVTLPLALPGIIAGMVLCFAKALGEFGATITFVSNIPGETQTISAAIYTFTQIPGGDAAAFRLVVIAVVIALMALIASEWFARRAGMRYHGD